MGVLITRALLFEVYISAPDFWKLPTQERLQEHPNDMAGLLQNTSDIQVGAHFPKNSLPPDAKHPRRPNHEQSPKIQALIIGISMTSGLRGV